MHIAENDEHARALEYVSGFILARSMSSVLDVGTGTGRALRYFSERLPHVDIRGIDPVPAMLDRARDNGVPADILDEGSGEALPYESRSFDAVCEFGVLHHTRDPAAVLDEMMRVAREAVFLSDSNRFGQGSWIAGMIKLALVKARLWTAFDHLKTGGKRYRISDDDGLSYSYSVYDSFSALSSWADTVFFIGTQRRRNASWFHPLITTPSVLLCALRADRGST